MSENHAADAVARLIAAFGSDITQDRAAIYIERLGDIEPELLARAVNEILDKQKFFPAIGEVRQAAGRLSGVTCVLPAAALEIIRQADVRKSVFRRDGSFAYTERLWDWPPMNEATQLAVGEALAKAGEPCGEDGEARFGWEMGFQKVYEVEAATQDARMLSDLSRARLPGPKPQIALPRPEPVKFQPDPQDIPIPTCFKCQKHMAFFETPEGMICGFCQRGQGDNPMLPRGDRE